ncbi:hypothetical protein F4780DRAFT_777286 [Xylariomycetidae sp. FL0641]|nr:hypothetical protein F4780DRAFT_777286 [Xylariomycetidae sp. FL0641]
MDSKEIRYDGSGMELVVETVNGGWKRFDKSLPVNSFSGHRGKAPKALDLVKEGEIQEDPVRLVAVKVSLAAPSFDPGLGCFGNALKVVETGKGELANLWYLDALEVSAAKDLQSGELTWDTGDWLHSQRRAQKGYKGESLLEGSDPSDTSESSEEDVRQELMADSFLGRLDNLESAEPKVTKVQTMPGDREGIWDDPDPTPQAPQKEYEDWVEAADDVEASASLPAGTRFYKGSGVE